MAGNNTEENK